MIDTRTIVERLRRIESIAVIPRVSSTNLLARRVVKECIENERALPQAIIIAREQFAGRGRNQRRWSSPAGKGIYATTLLTVPTRDLALIPLEMANVVASYLRDVFAVETQVKWPNDVYAQGRKIAGILVEARVQQEQAFLAIGIGLNVEPVADGSRPNAISMCELSPRGFRGLDEATVAFVEHLDHRLTQPLERQRVISEWRALSMHCPGDPITFIVGDRNLKGTWAGIDDQGRALLRQGETTIAVSAGDIIVEPPVESADSPLRSE
jgi:BirA family transcriptional regulator, biotin operon repressor / biotin---[acetyl-CoA-carboxylase] ligase